MKLEDPGMERTQDHLHVHLNIYTIADSLAASDNQKTVRPLVHPRQGRPRLNISQHLNKVSTVLDWKHPKKASRKRETEKAGVNCLLPLWTQTEILEPSATIQKQNYVMRTHRIWEDLSGASKLPSTEAKCVANDSGWKNGKDHSWIKSHMTNGMFNYSINHLVTLCSRHSVPFFLWIVSCQNCWKRRWKIEKCWLSSHVRRTCFVVGVSTENVLWG